MTKTKLKLTRAQAQERLIQTCEAFAKMGHGPAGSKLGDAPIEATVGFAVAAASALLQLADETGLSREMQEQYARLFAAAAFDHAEKLKAANKPGKA